MATLFATVTEEEIRQMNEEATPANTKPTGLVNTKTTTPLSVGATQFSKYHRWSPDHKLQHWMTSPTSSYLKNVGEENSLTCLQGVFRQKMCVTKNVS